MVKSQSFVVNPAVLSVLLSLRLRDDLFGVRASGDRVYKDDDSNSFGKKGKGNKKGETFINKKARKALKEKKQVEKEITEAEASVTKQEKEHNVRRDYLSYF
jgi:nucleolar complex protein 3